LRIRVADEWNEWFRLTFVTLKPENDNLIKEATNVLKLDVQH
jgi:hypothetical protein